MILNFDEEMELAYGECINQDVIKSPKKWVIKYIDDTPSLKMYDLDGISAAVRSAVQAVDKGCDEVCPNDGLCKFKCDGC